MTVSTTSARVAYSGNGATTAFATPYPFFATSDLVVNLVSAAGVTTLQVETTNYAVTGGNGETGTVTMVTAPASGTTLIITRSVPYLQNSDYLANDSFPATVVESDFDRLTMQVQQVLSLTQSGPVLPITFTPGTDTQPIIPLPVAGKVLVGNSGATGWDNTAIADLSLASIPVALTSPASGDLLRYNGSNWINTTTLNGAYTVASLTVSGLQAMSGAAINMAKGADIASATTTDIGAATGNYLDVTGNATITGLGTVQAGTRRTVRFTGTPTLTHNATSLIMPGGVNYVATANSVGDFVSLGSGNWRCTDWTWADGRSTRAMVGDSGSGGTSGLVPAPAAGDADKYLKGDGTYERGARRLLATKTLAGAASATFLAADGFNAAKYCAYEIEFSLLPATDGADLQCTISTDGGGTWKTGAADYGWMSHQFSGGGSSFASGTSAYIQLIDDISNAAGEGANGTLRITSRGTGARATELRSLGPLTRINAAGTLHMEMCVGFYNASTAVDGFRFAMSSGNMTGEMQIYGIAK